MRRRAILSALFVVVAIAGAVRAAEKSAPPPPLAEGHGDLDGDGRPERLILTREAHLSIDDGAGHLRGELALPLGKDRIESATIGVTEVGGHRLAHLVARLGGSRALEAVITLDAAGAHLLFSERTGPVGDGDRAVALALGAHEMDRWQTSPTEVRCDGEDRLFFERFSFATARFEPAELIPPTGSPLEAAATPPPGLDHPPLGIFHFVAESTDPSAAGERRADYLAAPHELEDGTLRTSWVAGPPGEGRGAWVAARTADPHHLVTALRIAPGPGPAPRRLSLLVGKSAWSVDWPKAGGTLYAVLPRPEPADCVAVVIAEPPPKASSPGTALAEVAIYTDADGAGGLGALAEEVARGGQGADGAAQVLQTHGKRATPVLTAALATATGSGRRRLIEILGALGDPEAAPALGRALETAAPNERAPLIAGLSRLGTHGASEAARIFGDDAQAEDARADAATILGAIAGGEQDGAEPARSALVAGAGRGSWPVRSAALSALAKAGAASPISLGAMVAALKEGSAAGSSERSGDLARALGIAGRSSSEPLRKTAEAALAGAYRRAGDFALELRLLRALGDLGAASPQTLALLAKVAHDEPDEVLRREAVKSAGSLGTDSARPILRAASSDRDPGVRRAALAGLATRPGGDSAQLLTRALSSDSWPLVRTAAAEGLAGSCSAAGVPALLARAAAGEGEKLRGADRSETVRRAALVSLGRCAPRDPAIARALESPAEPASVRELAAALVAKGGGPQAGPTLARTLVGVLSDPASDERSAGLAVSITRALGRTGDRSEAVLEALGAASNEPLVPAIRAAAMESIGTLCPDGARPALERGAADRDGTVRRAAAQALARCHR